MSAAGLPDHEGKIHIEGKCWLKLKTPQWEVSKPLKAYLSEGACPECRESFFQEMTQIKKDLEDALLYVVSAHEGICWEGGRVDPKDTKLKRGACRFCAEREGR